MLTADHHAVTLDMEVTTLLIINGVDFLDDIEHEREQHQQEEYIDNHNLSFDGWFDGAKVEVILLSEKHCLWFVPMGLIAICLSSEAIALSAKYRK